MKVIFLDFDGVLNSHQYLLKSDQEGKQDTKIFSVETLDSRFHSFNAWNLGFILNMLPDLQVVISSTARKYFSILTIDSALQKHGVPPGRIIGVTGEYTMGDRTQEIKEWVQKHQPEKYLALDDYPLYQIDHIWIDPRNGLLYSHALEVIEHFEPDFKPPLYLL